MEVLYDTAAVHSAIKRVLTKNSSTGRRVVVVAYIGDAAEAFLPDPMDLEIVCCLQPVSTSARALEKLRQRGAKLFHTPKLHMKVYWSSTNGCVITSANASASGLAVNGLKEAGVFLASKDVDIERLWDSVRPVEVRSGDLLRLEQKTDRALASPAKVNHSKQNSPFTFGDWNKSSSPKRWKLGLWKENVVASKAAISKAKADYGKEKPFDWLNFAGEAYEPFEWILCWQVDSNQKPKPYWIYVDSVVPIDKGDPAFTRAYPRQAIQIHSNAFYPYPPFDVTSARFRKALNHAVNELGSKRLWEVDTIIVPKDFVALLKKHWSSEIT